MTHIQTRSLTVTVAMAIAALLPGCVISVKKCRDERRTKVRFATAHAAQVFYDAALLPHGPSKNGVVDIMFTLYLPISIGTWKTRNVLFNQAVREADMNHDGVITDSEADRFVKQAEEQSARDARKFFRKSAPPALGGREDSC